MFNVSNAMNVMWRFTGLGTLAIDSRATGRINNRLSAVYSLALYTVYACLCASIASTTFEVYRSPASTTAEAHKAPASTTTDQANATNAKTGGKLQIQLIRDTNMALLFVACTATYWCTNAYRRLHADVHDEHKAIARRLFGGRPSEAPRQGRVEACCWALYALLAVALSLDVQRHTGPAPWIHGAAYVWGHYALLTGNMQFAVTVFALCRCYCELNERMRSGRAARQNGWFDSDAVHSPAKTSDALLQNSTFICLLDKVNLITMLKYWSDMHWSITQIVFMVNNLFKFRLFIFFLCGLLHLMLTPYLLSLTILNEDIEILPHIMERALWFVIHIFRVVLMIYPCAILGEEAAKTQILLGSYLNTKFDFFDIKKVETYAQHLEANKPEFSIYSMFVIDRQLVITLTGAVTTYLVIILQLPGQS